MFFGLRRLVGSARVSVGTDPSQRSIRTYTRIKSKSSVVVAAALAIAVYLQWLLVSFSIILLSSSPSNILLPFFLAHSVFPPSCACPWNITGFADYGAQSVSLVDKRGGR